MCYHDRFFIWKGVSAYYESASAINQLIETNNYITIKKLAEHFHVSERTVHSDLNVIETWFRDKQLPLMIERKRGQGSC